ncbi:hypothetical protein B0H13DRAFT_1858467 [Mycena leptocephala]|nr:hypothetical protein B0H13DRAFT_1858467 [Mycena leptocephala]
MEAPGLKTRTKNKHVRPGVAAGVDKKTWRTKDQMARARDDESTAKAQAALNEKKKLKRLAALEDQQHRDDITYAATANHPPDKPAKANIPAVVDSDAKSQSSGTESGSGDELDTYQQPDEASDSDNDAEDADAESSSDPPKKKRKLKTASRADVIASRTTQDSTGTPAVDVPSTGHKRKAAEGSKANAAKKAKKDAKVKPKKKSGLDIRGSKSQAKDAASAPEDDSMVAPRGPALDDNEEEQVERPQKGKKKKGIPTAPPIHIKPIAPKKVTGKAARGGDSKWTLKHLPDNTADKFTYDVVPLAREQVGAGTLSPWSGLTVAQIQVIIDKVYGADKYTVVPGDVWCGLIGYRLHDWHGGFATHSQKGIKIYLDGDDGEDEEEYEEGPVDNIPTDGTVPDPTPPAGAGPTVSKFDLKTPAGIAEFMEWSLELHKESGTMPFHWKQWGDGIDKQGLFQSDMILYVFAYHLSSLDTIPAKYPRLTAPPVAALLLAVQAVQRELQFWRTGVYNNPQPTTRANWFSSEHWDDHTIANPNPAGRKTKLVCRATKYLATVMKWDTAHWDDLEKAGREYIEPPSHRRATSSRSASEAGDNVFSEDEDVIIVSD